MPENNTESQLGPLKSENSDLNYVGIVVAIIGGTVLLLGLVGVALMLS